MPGSFLVARLFGIDIRLHFSWILIFGLIFYSLWTEIFPADYSFWSSQETLVVAVITALLFFCSIVAHELSHSLVARRFKMQVSSITLFLLGGVANLRQEPPSARVEFLMAAAGPGMSLLLGIAGLAIAGTVAGPLLGTFPDFHVADRSGVPSYRTVGAIAAYLGNINVLLAIFNLIPGFPLDGGRVLRSIIWAISGRRATATAIAARGGQIVAGLFVLWAIAQFTEGVGLWFWPLLLAYFLFNAATQSMQQERITSAVAGQRIAPLMTTSFVSAPPAQPVASVVRDLMLPRNLRAVPIVGGGAFLGLATSDDVRRVDHDRWSTTPIEEVMTRASALPTLSPEDDLMTALQRFNDAPVLPVLRDGALVGLLDRDAVANYVRMRDLFTGGR